MKSYLTIFGCLLLFSADAQEKIQASTVKPGSVTVRAPLPSEIVESTPAHLLKPGTVTVRQAKPEEIIHKTDPLLQKPVNPKVSAAPVNFKQEEIKNKE